MRYLVQKFGNKPVFSDTSVGFPNIVAKSVGEEIESRILNHRNPLTSHRGLCVRQVYLVLWNEVCILLYPFDQRFRCVWHIQASHTQARLENYFVDWCSQAVSQRA